MFARYYVYVEHPYDEVLRALRTSHWAACLDGDGGDELLARAGIRPGQLPIYKHTRVRPGRPVTEPTRLLTVVPLSWQATGGPPLFPDMEGDLEIEPFGPVRSQLTLSVTYGSPTGALGDAIDRVALHRLADAAVERFVHRLAATVAQMLAEPAPHPPAKSTP